MVGNASREQDERVAESSIASKDENELKHETSETPEWPQIRRKLAVEGKDEGGADADASPPNAQTEDANED